MTGYPSAEDYIRAVQRPDLVFDRPELAEARFDVHPMLKIPVPASGTTAVVFRATVGGTAQALRFFTREDASTQQRYTALNAWFTERDLTGDVANCRWVDDAILVNGRRWPMVQMEWVDGRTLDRHVEDLVETDDRAALETLAGSWRDLLRRIQAARFAHGDLQHGNVLVDTAGRLRLVDFDSSWITPFTGSPPPSEGGHRNYQPEKRLWGPWMDTFPGLVVYLSLLALAREPNQWEQFNDGENLLFRHRDYLPPHRTQAWSWVERLHDPQIDGLAARLRACCAPGWTATGDLEGLIAEPVPWWTRTAAHPPAGAPPEPGPTTAPPRPRPQPGPRPTGQPMWWQQPTGPQPGPTQPPPTQPAPARAAVAGRVLRAVVTALAWVFGSVLIAGALVSLASSNNTVIAALPALVLALIVLGLVLVVRRRRRRRRQPPGKAP
ncbi:hypothetical protein [Frankia sp. Cppng1_Ct_nod]|uniref:hypothetical protein n=1 Tax=Frankia sp. Cppng1_Ct_nod TaxID=2897162 RepID=UPI0020254780|nr:hypothetical protein [Frankia sp. Cppng1_Ct_nod]